MSYAIGEVAVVVPAGIVNYFKNVFLLDVALLPAWVVGIVLLISTLWDAATDIMLGIISDRTVSVWGRRRAYIILGSILYAAFFYAFWQSPLPLTGDLLLREVYYFTTYFLYKTCATIMTIPYYALTAELTSSYQERTNLTSIRAILSLLCTLALIPLWGYLTSAIPMPNDPAQPDLQLGYSLSALLAFPVIIIPAFIAGTYVKEPPLPPPVPERASKLGQRSTNTCRHQTMSVLSNWSFLATLAIFLSANLASQFCVNNLALYVKYVLLKASALPIMILVLQGSTILSVFLWTAVTMRLNKQHTFLLSLIFFIGALGSSWVIGPNTHLALVYLTFAVGGCGVGGLMLLPWTMMADCIDVDELKTGIRREGLYFSLFVLLQKVALAGALAGANYALDFAGYQNPLPGSPDYQPPAVIRTLKIMIGPVPCALAALSILPALFFPMTKKKHAALTRKLNAQRRFRAETRKTTLRHSSITHLQPHLPDSPPDLALSSPEKHPPSSTLH